MKIIDLLNKIANGEELPKKFKFAHQIFNIDRYGNIVDEEGDSILESIFTDFSNINDEIEIIEESEDIEKIIDYRTSDDELYNDNFGDFKSTINELIQAVKQLDLKINK